MRCITCGQSEAICICITRRRLNDALEAMASRPPDDRYHSSVDGKIVSDEFAKENPDTTFLGDHEKKSEWRKEGERLLGLLEDTENHSMVLQYMHSLYVHAAMRLRVDK